MIYDSPTAGNPLDQGDLIDACPLLAVAQFVLNDPSALQAKIMYQRVLVVTQTCDFANSKVTIGTVATVFDAQELIDDGSMKPADIKWPLRAARVWGLYFLPADAALALGWVV